MKKFVILAASLFTIITTTFAQTETQKTSPFAPQKGDWGTSILIDGLIDNIQFNSTGNDYGQNILFARYYLKNDLVLRAGFGLELNNDQRETADSVGVFLEEVDSLRSNFNLNVSFGIEKHLGINNRLDPYLFSQIDLTFIGKTNDETESRRISSIGTERTQTTIKRDGGIAFGLQAGGGFNYFLTNRFSLGTELALRILYVSEGGTISENSISTDVNGVSVSNFESREDLSNRADINVRPNALINVSYFF